MRYYNNAMNKTYNPMLSIIINDNLTYNFEAVCDMLVRPLGNYEISSDTQPLTLACNKK